MILISNLQIDAVLSAGSCGIIVYKARLKESVINYAVKRVPRAVYEGSPERIRGIRYLKQLCADHHPHILQLAAVQGSENHIWVVYEYCAGASLLQLLMAEGTLMLPAVKAIVRDLALALEHLNRLGIVHGSVRPAAILLSENGVVKLASFECARLVGGEPLENSLAHPRYSSPEVFSRLQASSAMDVWSLGCVSYEMLVGTPPFSGTTHDDLANSVFEDDLVFPDLSDDFDSFLSSMLVKDAGARMPIERMSEHPRLRGASRGMRPRDSSFSMSEPDGKLSEVREEGEEEEDAAEVVVGTRRRVATWSEDESSP